MSALASVDLLFFFNFIAILVTFELMRLYSLPFYVFLFIITPLLIIAHYAALYLSDKFGWDVDVERFYLHNQIRGRS